MCCLTNPYYAPEHYGCRKVGEIERGFHYDTDWFDTIVVLASLKTGMFYIGTDEKCSCQTPFESYESLDCFDGPLTVGQCVERVIKLWEWVGEKPDRQLKVLLSSILDIEEPPAGLP